MKPKYLFIAEKKSLREKIEQAYFKNKDLLNYQATFTNTAGHCVRLALPNEYKDKSNIKIPWIPSKFEMKVIKETANLYENIKKTYKEGNWTHIVNACDPEREGQYIFYLIRTNIGMKEQAKRFWTNDLTEKSILNALMNLRDNDSNDTLFPSDRPLKNLTDASILRARNDYLVGMNFSSALNIPVGRVRTAVLNMVVQRDSEIENYIKTTNYELKSCYKNGIEATLLNNENEKMKFDNKSKAISFSTNNLKDIATINKYKVKERKEKAPALFNLSQLQAFAGEKFGINADKVLELCQRLYEKRYLSYPRTSCKYISTEILKETQEIFNAISCVEKLTPFLNNISINHIENDKTYVNDKALAEEGHTALIPTANMPNLNNLTEEEKNIYEIVATRFLAIFLPPCIIKETTITLNNNGYNFVAKYNNTLKYGYKNLYKNIEEKEKNISIPMVIEGEYLNIIQNIPVEKNSTCPSHFTDGTLILALENPIKYLTDSKYSKILKEVHGIGTDATRTAIINKLISQSQLERKTKGKKEYLISTENGKQIISILKDKDITSIEMTGEWEDKLNQVAKGTISYETYYNEMISYIITQTNTYKSLGEKISSTADLKCPFCNNISVRKGKYGFYCKSEACKFSISNDNIKWLKEKWKISLTEQAVINIINGKRIKVKNIIIGFKKNEKGYATWDINFKK